MEKKKSQNGKERTVHIEKVKGKENKIRKTLIRGEKWEKRFRGKDRAYEVEGLLERMRDYPAQTFDHSCIHQPHIYTASHWNVARTVLGTQAESVFLCFIVHSARWKNNLFSPFHVKSSVSNATTSQLTYSDRLNVMLPI